MERMCKGKGIVIGINSVFGFFGCKTRGSCVYNEITEKKGSFCSFTAWDNTYKLRM